MEDLERQPDGTFASGHIRRGGRKKGSLNRFTSLRQEFVDVYGECNGREKLEGLLKDDPKGFFSLLVSLMPKLKVQEERRLEVSLKDMSTAELLQMAGVSEEDLEEISKRG